MKKKIPKIFEENLSIQEKKNEFKKKKREINDGWIIVSNDIDDRNDIDLRLKRMFTLRYLKRITKWRVDELAN